MKRLVVLLTVIAALPLLAAAAQSPEEVVSVADRAEKSGDFQQAIELYTGFIQDFPDHVRRANIEYRLAICYDNVGRTVPALQHLKESVAGPADKATGRHRPDAFMRIARLYADASKYQDAADALDVLLKEGADLYEDEAQSLRASYLALLGKYEDSAMLFNVLRNKKSSEYAKEAGFKLAIVWLKAARLDLAKSAIDEFVQRHPGDPRICDLFIRLARVSFEQRQYKNSAEICQRVLGEFKDAAEAIEAAFIVALIYRNNGMTEKAIEAFLGVAKMPQAAHNSPLASESIFEVAQIYRKQVKDLDKAATYYREAAVISRDAITDRQQHILEQSLLLEADIMFQRQAWSAAFDRYVQVRKINPKLNVIDRLVYCKSRMSGGGLSFDLVNEEDIAYIRKRIADHPESPLALQSEIFILERSVERVMPAENRKAMWSALWPFVEEYAALLKKYPADILKVHNMGAYIKLRQGMIHLFVPETQTDYADLCARGVALCEQSLAEAPDAPFRIEALESLAVMANRCNQNAKAFDAYLKLHALVAKDPALATRRPPSEYLQGLVISIDDETRIDDAARIVERVINDRPATNAEARDARFYMAELQFMKKNYTVAAARFAEVVKMYGPPQDGNGAVAKSWVRPATVDPVLDQVYEAAHRIGQCWRAQGVLSNMVAAYRWEAENLNHRNPRVAEAWFVALTAGVDFKTLPPVRKEEVARELWTRIVNNSLDAGSKAFKEGYHPWVHDQRAVPYVKAAVLKAGQYLGEVNRHKLAAEFFREYTVIYRPDPKRLNSDGEQMYQFDGQYEIACYASGKEFLLAGMNDLAVKQFRVFLDDLRESRFRIPALMAIGYYGTQMEMFADALAAYATLLDEYGKPNPLDPFGVPVPVPLEKRLRKDSPWNGVRLEPPVKWDPGKIRFGLGFLQWRKEDWPMCEQVLTPFFEEPDLRNSPTRAEALFMLAHSLNLQQLPTRTMKVLEAIIRDHPDYKAIEEVYTKLARVALDVSDWKVADETCKRFTATFKNTERQAYMNLYGAAAMIGLGKVEEGERILRDLAKAETYEDVKSGACYHLALLALKRGKPNANAEARELLAKSLDFCVELPALLQAAKCAYDARDWQAAREHLDKLSRMYPKADRGVLEEVQRLRRDIAAGEAAAGRRPEPAKTK